jgi:phycocyanobilin lyase alpha subunit
LIDAIGVEIGNHCQGNIRRVAACALGDIDWIQQDNRESLTITMDKLSWTLQYPDDWGLRYSACIALESISNARAKDLLIETSQQETDPVISRRVNIALSRITKNNDY